MSRPQPKLAAQAPLLPFTVLLVAGIALQAVAGGCLCAVIASGCSAMAFALLYAHGKVFAAVSALAPAIGVWLAWSAMPASTVFPADNVVCTAKVLETAPASRGIQAVARIDSLVSPTSGLPVAVRPFKVRLGISGESSEIIPGCEIVFRATLTPQSDKRSHPLETNHNSRLARTGIALTGFIDADSIRIVRPPRGIVASLRSLSDDVNRAIAFSPASPSTQALLSAMLTGHRDWLTPSARELYSTAGIAHILALSGMHVAILTLICSLITLPLTLCGHRKWAMTATICMLWIFAIATGMSVSVVRSAIMASLMLTALIADRRPVAVNALCAAALAVLLADPLQLFSVSFQLSFAAVLSIILLYPPVSRMLPRHALLRLPLEYCAVSVAAVAGTGILCAYHFGVFQPYFLLSNLMACFLLPWFMGLGVLMLLLQAIGIPSWPVAAVLDFISGTLDSGAAMVSALPGAPLMLPGVSLWSVAAYFATLIFIFAAVRTRRAAPAIAASITAVAGLAIWTITTPARSEASALFAERSEPHFTLVYALGDTLRICTAAPPAELGPMESRITSRHSALMSIGEISHVHTGRLTHGDTISYYGRRLLYIERPVAPGCGHVNYLVIGSKYRGDLSETASIAAAIADTVVFSPGLNTSRCSAIIRRLSANGTPSINLRHSPLLLTPLQESSIR